ncbi:hypothetical protein DFH09DRAFT_1333126 [Mycena vulgaris]|nr:hypothetical protein DFH09DRAFT_1333126 [Mycena vulgaris]
MSLLHQSQRGIQQSDHICPPFRPQFLTLARSDRLPRPPDPSTASSTDANDIPQPDYPSHLQRQPQSRRYSPVLIPCQRERPRRQLPAHSPACRATNPARHAALRTRSLGLATALLLSPLVRRPIPTKHIRSSPLSESTSSGSHLLAHIPPSEIHTQQRHRRASVPPPHTLLPHPTPTHPRPSRHALVLRHTPYHTRTRDRTRRLPDANTAPRPRHSSYSAFAPRRVHNRTSCPRRGGMHLRRCIPAPQDGGIARCGM